MLYLSRYCGNATKDNVKDLYEMLCNRQHLHRNICLACGNRKREDIQALYFLQDTAEGVDLYLQSNTVPEKIAGFKLIQTIEVGSIFFFFLNGQVLRFKLETAPYRSEKGKKHYLLNETDRFEWLSRQGKKYGFIIGDVLESRDKDVHFMHKGSEGEKDQKGSISTYIYQGYLTVTDRNAFIRMLGDGLGPGKAYGLGMMRIG